MAVCEYFAETYLEARRKFLHAAGEAKADLTHHILPNLRGPSDEELITDVAVLGSRIPENLLLIISGTHGVEGFCGSGCQVGYLTDQVYEILSPRTQAVLVHALNPFGFAWLRRVNEDNVDLNRNFRDFSKDLPTAENYESIHEWLIPADWDGYRRDQADTALNAYIAEKGWRTVQAEITAGQYSRPNGLFYGGVQECWSNRLLRQLLADHVTSTVDKLAVLDLHTGLGTTGFGEPIYVGPTSEGFELAKNWYGQEVKSTLQGTSVSAAVTGSIADALPQLTPTFRATYLALEFGTVPAPMVLTALRADHWLHAIPDRTTQLRSTIEHQIRDAFYCDASWWKAAIYGRFADFAVRATRAIQN
jgi:hypothetical protein